MKNKRTVDAEGGKGSEVRMTRFASQAELKYATDKGAKLTAATALNHSEGC